MNPAASIATAAEAKRPVAKETVAERFSASPKALSMLG